MLCGHASGLTLSISMACMLNGAAIGVSGVDLHLEDLVQDVTYFNQGDDAYAFIINTYGKATWGSDEVLLYSKII